MTLHLIPLAFLAFLTVCAVTGIVTDYKKRKASLEALRAAIERGQQLDPALVEKLMAPEKPSGIAPMSLIVGGIVTSAAGIGVMILSLLLSHEDHSALYPILGGGIVTLCIGAGLILAARTVEQYRKRQPHGPT
ncbi:MAG TPA: DUF6249 domain-containing protein [Steroidobacteraceae bacterium]|jgi:hypothetical protein|nr:DUF6249 domain-containing protein [Steroidobacteraceae bacterium]